MGGIWYVRDITGHSSDHLSKSQRIKAAAVASGLLGANITTLSLDVSYDLQAHLWVYFLTLSSFLPVSVF